MNQDLHIGSSAQEEGADALIDAVLHCEISQQDLSRLTAGDTFLSREIATARSIQDSLRRLHAGDPALLLPELGRHDAEANSAEGSEGASAPGSRRAGSGRLRLLRRPMVGAAVAAVLVVAAALAVVLNRPAAEPRLVASAVYERYQESFKPEHVCATPEEFRDYSDDYLGVPLEANFEAGVTLVGWATTSMTYKQGGSRVLLALSPGGEQVVVILQKPGEEPPGREGLRQLRMHEARMGGLALFEISPLDEAVVLPLLSAEGRCDRGGRSDAPGGDDGGSEESGNE